MLTSLILIFLWITASVAADAVNPNGIKTLLTYGLSTFPIEEKPHFSNSPRSLLRNHADCAILGNWVFDSFLLAHEPCANSLRAFETCVLVNYNLCEKLVSSLEWSTTFDEDSNVVYTSVYFLLLTLIY